MPHCLLVQGNKLRRALLGPVHKVASDGAGTGVDRRLPQEDQRVTSDLAEAQIVGGACKRSEERQEDSIRNQVNLEGALLFSAKSAKTNAF